MVPPVAAVVGAFRTGVASSVVNVAAEVPLALRRMVVPSGAWRTSPAVYAVDALHFAAYVADRAAAVALAGSLLLRSEERRVGKEGVRKCRFVCSSDHSKKK